MNNDLEQFSEERLKEIADFDEDAGLYPSIRQCKALARIALAAKQAKSAAFDRTNAFTDLDLEGMAHGNNPVANAYRELLAFRRAANSPAIPDGWIKCSDRMPDSKNDVQLFCGDTREQFVGFHRGNGVFQIFIMNDVIGECEPTHWMPLAAAPKPESE